MGIISKTKSLYYVIVIVFQNIVTEKRAPSRIPEFLVLKEIHSYSGSSLIFQLASSSD